MTRTSIDIDDQGPVRAAAILGTTTKVDTVNQAFQAVVDSRTTAIEAERKRFDEFLDLIGEQLAEVDVRAEAWR